MATIARPAAYVAVVAALLLSGIGLPIDSARADDNCVSAPSAAAPAGQHWYYRSERGKPRKCWYLHATLPLLRHSAAKPHAAPAKPALEAETSQLPFAAPLQLPNGAPPQAANAVPAPQPAADPPPEAASPQSAPHVTVLTVKPAPALLVDTASASQAATPEPADQPPVPQISPGNAKVPVDGDSKPASGANPATVPGASVADHHALASADTAATASARTRSADLFFLLAFALGIAAALIALCSKMAGRTRTPRLSDHPDDARRRVVREEDIPFLAPRQPQGSSASHARKRTQQSPSPAKADSPAVRSQDREPKQAEQVAPTLKDIELALNALRQARRSVAQT